MFGEEVVAHLYRADALGHVISFSIYLDCATHHLVPCGTEVHGLFGGMSSFHNSCIQAIGVLFLVFVLDIFASFRKL